jgi:RNA polymerase sigma-70 factor (ECF subfamily)
MLDPHALDTYSDAPPTSATVAAHLCAVRPMVPPAHPPRMTISQESSDAALVAAVAFDRDEVAFERLYQIHVRAVTAAAVQICRNRFVAEEIAQRTFTKLWERAARLATKSVRLRPWLLTVARNAAIDHLRAESVCVPLTDVHADVPADGCPQTEAIASALAADLAPALAALPAHQRTVIELRYFADLSFPEIAERIGEPLETVKSRARLGVERLRRSFV